MLAFFGYISCLKFSDKMNYVPPFQTMFESSMLQFKKDMMKTQQQISATKLYLCPVGCISGNADLGNCATYYGDQDDAITRVLSFRTYSKYIILAPQIIL